LIKPIVAGSSLRGEHAGNMPENPKEFCREVPRPNTRQNPRPNSAKAQNVFVAPNHQ
jgi:hypothetical protein